MEKLNQLVPYLVIAPAWIVPAVIAVGSLVAGLVGARKDRKERREAEARNQQYIKEQLEYNEPKNQMLRYQEAGLNPNLIYGQGSPSVQSSPQQALEPPVQSRQSMANLLAQFGPLINQTMMTQSQTQAIDAKTRQTTVQTELNRLQAEVLKKNPLLDEAGFKAIIDALKSTAEIKASEATSKRVLAEFQTTKDGEHGVEFGYLKLVRELQLLEQKYELSKLDAKIKAEVLQGKDFQNDILKIQQQWMTDGEVTPQHIYQFIQMLLLKVL